MSDLEISFRALKVLDSARYLFNRYGFHNVGVDRIIETAQIAKGTFYKYFQSKEQLIEMGLRFQTDALKQEVSVLIHFQPAFSLHEKLRRIYFLHVSLEGYYHLPLKAIFEIKTRYPKAYQIVVEYRKWLVKEICDLLLGTHAHATQVDAEMFLFVVDGALLLLKGGNTVEDPTRMIEGFLVGLGR